MILNYCPDEFRKLFFFSKLLRAEDQIGSKIVFDKPQTKAIATCSELLLGMNCFMWVRETDKNIRRWSLLKVI